MKGNLEMEIKRKQDWIDGLEEKYSREMGEMRGRVLEIDRKSEEENRGLGEKVKTLERELERVRMLAREKEGQVVNLAIKSTESSEQTKIFLKQIDELKDQLEWERSENSNLKMKTQEDIQQKANLELVIDQYNVKIAVLSQQLLEC